MGLLNKFQSNLVIIVEVAYPMQYIHKNQPIGSAGLIICIMDPSWKGHTICVSKEGLLWELLSAP